MFGGTPTPQFGSSLGPDQGRDCPKGTNNHIRHVRVLVIVGLAYPERKKLVDTGLKIVHLVSQKPLPDGRIRAREFEEGSAEQHTRRTRGLKGHPPPTSTIKKAQRSDPYTDSFGRVVVKWLRHGITQWECLEACPSRCAHPPPRPR
jgi:hypothetical protein